jgi:hypothetical protein
MTKYRVYGNDILAVEIDREEDWHYIICGTSLSKLHYQLFDTWDEAYAKMLAMSNANIDALSQQVVRALEHRKSITSLRRPINLID